MNLIISHTVKIEMEKEKQRFVQLRHVNLNIRTETA